MGRKPLPARIVTDIKLMLCRRLSQREIARRLRVARSSVQAIAGKRHRQSRYGRCPTCGGLVRRPCLACSLPPSPRRLGDVGGRSPYRGVQLYGGTRWRYQRLRKRKD